MPELKLKQLQYESDTWKRLLAFMIDENIHLKNRISDILKDRFDNRLLEDTELFQNRFVNEDKLIEFLRNDVAEFDKLLINEVFEDGHLKKEVDNKVKHIRRNIKEAEIQFAKLKQEFSDYFSEKI
jgi:Txe/YoeB family toxin of Txe-Axe toxin-antitoxin module